MELFKASHYRANESPAFPDRDSHFFSREEEDEVILGAKFDTKVDIWALGCPVCLFCACWFFTRHSCLADLNCTTGRELDPRPSREIGAVSAATNKYRHPEYQHRPRDSGLGFDLIQVHYNMVSHYHYFCDWHLGVASADPHGSVGFIGPTPEQPGRGMFICHA